MGCCCTKFHRCDSKPATASVNVKYLTRYIENETGFEDVTGALLDGTEFVFIRCLPPTNMPACHPQGHQYSVGWDWNEELEYLVVSFYNNCLQLNLPFMCHSIVYLLLLL